MHLSKIKAFAVALTLVAAANAQFTNYDNARMMGMSGAPMADISNVHSFPSLMTGYTNHLQASWNAPGLVGIFGVSDVFSIGLLANQGLVPGAWSYNAAWERLTTDDANVVIQGWDRSLPPGNQYNIPHLLLGFDFGGVQLGADIFVEYSAASIMEESSNSNTNPSGSSETNVDGTARIMIPGVRFSAGFGFGDIGILAKIGLGLPMANLEYEYESVSNTAAGRTSELREATIDSRDALYFEGGAEVGLPLLGVDWTIGGSYTRVSGAFESEWRTSIVTPGAAPVNTPSGDQGDYTVVINSLTDIYLSGEVNFMETAVAAFGYSFTRYAYVEDYEIDTTYTIGEGAGANRISDKRERVTTDADHVHSFVGGIENVWDNAWIFDSFALRAGARYNIYSIGRETEKSESSGTTSNPANSSESEREFRLRHPAQHTGVDPTIGIGVSKDFLSLDLALNMGNWVGVFTGPAVAVATVTVKF